MYNNTSKPLIKVAVSFFLSGYIRYKDIGGRHLHTGHHVPCVGLAIYEITGKIPFSDFYKLVFLAQEITQLRSL